MIRKPTKSTEDPARPWASPIGRNQKIKDRLLRIRRIVFRLRLSFRRLSFLRRRRKADYGEKQKAKSSFLKKPHKILQINRLQLTVSKNTHKKQEVERL